MAGRSFEEMSAEIRARQDAHREKLLQREDALSVYQRKWHKDHYHRMRRATLDAKGASLMDEARRAQQQQDAYERIRDTADPELRDLIEQQERDHAFGHRVKPLPFVRSLEERVSQDGLKLHELIASQDDEAA